MPSCLWLLQMREPGGALWRPVHTLGPTTSSTSSTRRLRCAATAHSSPIHIHLSLPLNHARTPDRHRTHARSARTCTGAAPLIFAPFRLHRYPKQPRHAGAAPDDWAARSVADGWLLRGIETGWERALIGGVQLAVEAVGGRGAGMRTHTAALDRTDRSVPGFRVFMCVGMSRGVFVAV